METLHIGISSNDAYATHLCTSIYSLFYNIDRKFFVNLYVFDGGISDINKEKIIGSCNSFENKTIFFIPMNKAFFNAFYTKGLSEETYFKLQIPEMDIFKNIKNFLFVDTDTMFHGDISTIFSIDLGDKLFGAVPYLWRGMVDYHEKMGTSLDNKYFNAGVLLMNLDLMRKNNFTQRIFEFLKNNHVNSFAYDEGALNKLFYTNWKEIPPKYNALPLLFCSISYVFSGYTREQYLEAKNKPVIVHFSGSTKPRNSLFPHPFKKEYFKYQSQTYFKDSKFKKILTTKSILKIAFYFFVANMPIGLYKLMFHKMKNGMKRLLNF